MVNMSRLSNKVAIVTGASKGIGGGIATALGAAGARVAVNYSSDREGAERVAQALTDNGGEAIAVGADVSKAAAVARLFQEVDSAFGRLEVLVNNAGVFRSGAFADITEQGLHVVPVTEEAGHVCAEVNSGAGRRIVSTRAQRARCGKTPQPPQYSVAEPTSIQWDYFTASDHLSDPRDGRAALVAQSPSTSPA